MKGISAPINKQNKGSLNHFQVFPTILLFGMGQLGAMDLSALVGIVASLLCQGYYALVLHSKLHS